MIEREIDRERERERERERDRYRERERGKTTKHANSAQEKRKLFHKSHMEPCRD